MVSVSGRKLGCRPAVVLPGQPRLGGLRMMARKAPSVLDRSHINPAPLMLGNDQIGDCTSVGLANALRATAALGGFQIGVDDDSVIQFYAESTGYRPGCPETDQGGIEVEVLSFAAGVGYQLEAGAYYPLWGTTDAQDRNALALIMASLGTVYLGVLLSQSDMNQIESTNGACVLEADNGAYGDTTPGSAGGHCLLGWSYSGLSDSDTVDLLTWGAIQKVTWGWLRSRIMEAHGLVWPQLTLANGLYPTGPDIDALKAQNVEFLTA
nr:hypothetical protein [Acetobacter lovaniensis]